MGRQVDRLSEDTSATEPAALPLGYRIADYLYDRVGRRGALLATLAGMDFTYGSAMLASYGLPPEAEPRWWPASVGVVAGIPVGAWGAIWVGVGLFLLTGIPRKASDRLQFAVAELLKVWWACAALLYWSETHSAGSWGPAAIYGGIAVMVLMCAGWRDVAEFADRPSQRRRRR